MSVLNCYLIILNDVVDKMVRNGIQEAYSCLAMGCQLLHTPRRQLLASLLVSVLLVGIKLNASKEIVQVIERRTELKTYLSLLQTTLEDEDMVAWLDDVQRDVKRRQDRIAAMVALLD